MRRAGAAALIERMGMCFSPEEIGIGFVDMYKCELQKKTLGIISIKLIVVSRPIIKQK